jgi:hypothetical protein
MVLVENLIKEGFKVKILKNFDFFNLLRKRVENCNFEKNLHLVPINGIYLLIQNTRTGNYFFYDKKTNTTYYIKIPCKKNSLKFDIFNLSLRTILLKYLLTEETYESGK